MKDESISLNKFISSRGICSRREADMWIMSGRVQINGQRAIKGNRVFPNDRIFIDGKSIHGQTKPVYILLNKPPGITCTTNRTDPDNIIDFVRHPMRIFPIGRLDKASSGLILLTNDGDIVNKILREENQHEKEYIVNVDKTINQQFIRDLSGGVPILGKKTRRCKVLPMGANTFSITLTQGMNRQIRRMCEHFNYKVMSLKRIRIMDIQLDNSLKAGQWRNLTPRELASIKNDVEHDQSEESARTLAEKKGAKTSQRKEKKIGRTVAESSRTTKPRTAKSIGKSMTKPKMETKNGKKNTSTKKGKRPPSGKRIGKSRA